MTDTNPAKFKKLVTLLRELFQLDQPDLDFGIYRIMHAKAGEVTDFLERDLLPQVKAAFASYQTADSSVLRKELEELETTLRRVKVDPDSNDEVRKLREQLKSAVDIGALENETYDHLFSFFRRYYSEGDFLAKRVYKPGVYAIPYEGEEVTLHWANKDQYYIKTSEYLRDYAFRLRPDAGDGQSPMRVHFKLVEAAEGEHGNVKAAEDSKRVFVLAAQDFIALEDGELSLRFEYRPATLQDWPNVQRDGKKKPPTQKELIDFAETRIVAADTAFADWLADLAKTHIKADGETAEYSRLTAHLRRYTARNTFDYFIHKDLGGFLRRELDFYIKNEVMHLDDVENETAPKVEQYLSKIKVIRRIAAKIIDFLAQLENFQKKLWLKKKFVTEATWLVALSQVPDDLLAEVCTNAAQREEWVALHAIDTLEGDTVTPGYSVPLTAGFLMAHPTLMVDTRLFDVGFSSRLLAGFEDADGCTDGVLVHGENSSALDLMHARYRCMIKAISIDPPYNTGNDGFIYKDSYQHSSWLSQIESSLEASRRLLSHEGSIALTIDRHEDSRLRLLLDSIFGSNNFVANIAWQKLYTIKNSSSYLSEMWDSILLYAVNKQAWRPFRLERSDEQEQEYGNPDCDSNGPWISNALQARNFYSAGRYSVTCPGGRYVDGPPAGTYWRMDEANLWKLDKKGRVWWGQNKNSLPRIKKYLKEMDRGVVPSDYWLHQFAGTNAESKIELRDLIGHEVEGLTPKPVRLIRRVLDMTCNQTDTILDHYAGSGTTGHATIELNRNDGGSRKFILVEQVGYFSTVLVPRLKKVTFTPDWKDGKPKRLATPEEAERSPRLIKVLRLESYEDTLNNLALQRNAQQQGTLELTAAQGEDGLREQYLLRYQLDVESKGSQSLLNISAFTDPTAYTLKVKTPGSDESREVNVDLLETFNWLLGLTVQHITAPRSFTAEIERSDQGRLQIEGRLKQNDTGPWWFRTVTGTTPEGRKTLVIWRKLTGDAEQDNLVLDTWFTNKQAYSVHGGEFDLIYVNGDNTLDNLRVDPENWKVRLIEADFQRLMFDGTES